MRLERLTKANIDKIKDKGIICYEKSETYLRELCTKFPLTDRIQQIIDDYKRNQGIFSFGGRELPVTDSFELAQIDFNENIILITSDYFMEAYETLCQNEAVTEKIDIVYYFINLETEYELDYREKYKEKELENLIIFRSGPHASAYVKGMDFSDNARALFEYMLKNRCNDKYKLVWLVKDPSDFRRYDKVRNVSFLSFDWSVSENKGERDKYYEALCLAKYLFMTDAYGFARNCRPDQVRVQLWHGCGFKTRVNFVRCEKRYEYTTVISDLYAEIHQKIYGLNRKQILVTGYAKEDWLFSKISKDYKKLLNIPDARKYIYWLPTFRSTEKNLSILNEYELLSDTGFSVVNTWDKMERVNELLKRENMVLVIKLHPFQNRKKTSAITYSNIAIIDNEKLFELDIQVNELLGTADALISDYSSAAVDYMLLDRPMAFLLDDVEEYESSRGFVFENFKDWLPGMEVFCFEDLLVFLREVSGDRDSTKGKRHVLLGKMHKYRDNNNCKRILEALSIV